MSTILQVPDLNHALKSYLGKGFRLDMILPADAPRIAIVSKNGESVRLESTKPEAFLNRTYTDHTHAIVSLSNCDSWITGRAGMEYRDLIPGRLGGQMIASHIRLGSDGAVPDYVHYHKAKFQMIFCIRGRIRVIYEDQGPPFWLEVGDCVLQPPEIRHRVLESVDRAEVIEIGVPAVHETWVEHDIELPTTERRPDRDFGGQLFVRHVEGNARWTPSSDGAFEFCDTGIAGATRGLADVRLTRTGADEANLPASGVSLGKIRFYFVLAGAATLSSAGQNAYRLDAGDGCSLEPGSDHLVGLAPNSKLLQVTASLIAPAA